jgi:4-diphosphocytidyl-2-C-methyl-D-erythritol kinase
LFFDNAFAKVNLGLHVLRRRLDGYHDIETIMLRIGWADGISVEASDRVSMESSDPSLPTDGRNLCIRAARMLADHEKISEGVHIRLDKQIPARAGLGGGSSDAAAVLRLASRLWEVDLARERMMELAAGIGSDVPFFLGPRVAFVHGRGEHVETVIADDVPFEIVVVMPPFSIPTGEAYEVVSPNDRGRPDLRAAFATKDLEIWNQALTNDFELPIARRYPEIEVIKNRLIDSGAGFASLSGSGAAVYGFFKRRSEAEQAARRLSVSGYRIWTGGQSIH